MASADSFYAAEASGPVTDWQDYSNYYDEYDDDEEVMLPLLSTTTRPERICSQFALSQASSSSLADCAHHAAALLLWRMKICCLAAHITCDHQITSSGA